VSECEGWRTITKIATGIDRIDAHLSRLEARVSELAATVERLTAGKTAAGSTGTGPGAAPDPAT
jgi:hypothetical protein